MYMLVAIRDGKTIECARDFYTRRDAEEEARRLNALPTHWQSPNGRLYHRPDWKVEVQRNGASMHRPFAVTPKKGVCSVQNEL
jgi:hypothetical protein